MNRVAWRITCLGWFVTCAAQAQPVARNRAAYPPQFERSTVETYKRVGDVALNVWIVAPPKADTPRPAIVFFFGGGWRSGSPGQFEPQCRHFAERGLVAIAADYRVESRHQVKPTVCVADAKSCLRWVRANAQRLGVDPQRIVAAGGSAGGHLAAATATLPGLDDPQDDKTVSCVPNALVLFNPAVVLAPHASVDLKGFGANATAERFGCEPAAISPLHHVRADLPPTLILHGRADSTVPFATVDAFTALMKKHGNRCELIGYDDQPHGFFNRAKYGETVAAAEAFLRSLGYVAKEPAK